jgi:hypothetical protein
LSYLCVWGGGRWVGGKGGSDGDCPFQVELFVLLVLLHILCYKSFHELHLAHVTLGDVNNCFNVRLISGNDSSLFTWYILVTMLNLPMEKSKRKHLKINSPE